ncbi:Aste57867_20678 [Aphanomyces stellatus]|uniref:Aste57867_20678 protein n=1 Tax=Aphanomyces stellatus TaxID=120398 RepID=A0A485LFN8_9STRA|nr:hypothetical protein As57867_020610 [Aphanomyces stellatus]VFT97358.1 Aste57867_20678 [Aphanomyces stellatus]
MDAIEVRSYMSHGPLVRLRIFRPRWEAPSPPLCAWCHHFPIRCLPPTMKLSFPSPLRFFRRLRGKSSAEEETRKLSPVPLAGASRAFSGHSMMCNVYAPSSSTNDEGCKTCSSCQRKYIPTTSNFKDFCSLDCKSAGYSKLATR